MSDQPDITTLRQQMANSQGIVEQCPVYLQLIRHKEVTWRDMLNSMEQPIILRVQSALRLHQLLDICRHDISVIEDPNVWRKMLEVRGYDLDEPIRRRLPEFPKQIGTQADDQPQRKTGSQNFLKRLSAY